MGIGVVSDTVPPTDNVPGDSLKKKCGAMPTCRLWLLDRLESPEATLFDLGPIWEYLLAAQLVKRWPTLHSVAAGGQAAGRNSP